MIPIACAILLAALSVPVVRAVAGTGTFDFASLTFQSLESRNWSDLGLSNLEDLFAPAAHAAELREGGEIPKPPSFVRRFWDSIKDRALIRRVRSITAWIAAGARFLWAIPKAMLRGDSDALIEALSGLLMKASAADTTFTPDGAPHSRPPADLSPAVEPDSTTAP